MKRNDERIEPYVQLNHLMIDSAAFKTLSPNAVWLYIHMLRQFKWSKGGYGHLVLPFADVKHKLSWRAFKQAQGELISYGFIWLLQKGGFKGHLAGRGPAVYAAGRDTVLGERWKERSVALLKDERAGTMRTVRREAENGLVKEFKIWVPNKTITRKASQENWKRAASVLEQKRRRPHRQRGFRESEPLKSSKDREYIEGTHENTLDNR